MCVCVFVVTGSPPSGVSIKLQYLLNKAKLSSVQGCVFLWPVWNVILGEVEHTGR